MTTDELRIKLDLEFGIGTPWPKNYDVDRETYANCCQAVFNWHVKNHLYILIPGIGYELTGIKLGQNNGLLFKNTQLIIK